ncbi:MAG: LCP family protein [Anaerolineales bacterium]|nr:LCP family protein [Anaerolineales bacterium]
MRIAVLAGFSIAAMLAGYLTYVIVRDFVAGWEMTDLPGITVRDATATPDPSSGVVPTPDLSLPPISAANPTPPPWDGADRVSLLIMGLDYRDWAAGEGPPRTDTMIVLTIDPINRTAGMLSVPRDLWVNIPGFEYGRINTAYQLGEAYQVLGGGPQLATDTVELLLGVPIDYYAQVDFGAFVRFIDEIGGLEIYIPQKITVDPLGEDNTILLKKGIRKLSGEVALAYARTRKTEGGDFDRSNRQQIVILATRQKLLKADNLPKLIAKSPVLYNELSSGIRTNMSLDQIIRLAWLASQIPLENIKRGIIGTDHVTFVKSPDGTQDVLKARTEKIRELRDEIFTVDGPTKPLAVSMDLAELIRTEGARLTVLNGSYTAGLAARTTEYLVSQGFNVVETGNSERFTSYTEITFHTGKPYTLKYLVELMQISEFRIRHFFDPASSADIVIILGDDWAANNPMP